MTASAAFSAHAATVEYILCIESVGWLTNERTGLSAGFDGDVFVTSDFNGDLASKLGCTIHIGLALPDSIEDKVDPVTYEYEPGGLNISIVDDGFLLANIAPHLTPSETTISTALDYSTETVVLTNGTNFAASSTIVVGGREMILLGSKAGTTPATYSNCTRGYLGTPRGRVDTVMPDDDNLAWSAGAIVESRMRYLYDRRVRLYAHVPGEATTGMMLLFSGKLRGISPNAQATEWQMEATGETVTPVTRVYVPATSWSAHQWAIWESAQQRINATNTANITGQSVTEVYSRQTDGARILFGFVRDQASEEYAQDAYAFATVYPYRSQPGGTYGMKSKMDSETQSPATTDVPQAPTIGNEAYVADSYMLINGKLIHAAKRAVATDSINPSMFYVLCDAINPQGDHWDQFIEERVSVRFLLDNVTDEWKTSRFAIDQQVRRHPIDVLLMFLTSMPNEMVVAAALAGSTATVLNLTTSTLGPVQDYWVGYALHCVEGANKGEVRTISASDVGGSPNTVTVERAFSNVPTAGDDYHIRNGAYDVLPMGWGMGIENWRIDIDSFEAVRDGPLAGATLGKFIIGTDKVDLLKLIQEEICQPYGILLYVDRTTGLLSCRYMGEAMGNGVIDTYVDITKADILEAGSVTYGVDKPLGGVDLIVRGHRASVVGHHYEDIGFAGIKLRKATEALTTVSTTDGNETVLAFRSPELSAAFAAHSLDKLKLSARLNSEDDCAFVSALMHARIKKNKIPSPILPLRLSLNMVETVQAGAVVAVTDDSIVDPFSGAVGMTSIVGRVIESRVVLAEENPGLDVTIELLGDVSGAKIAPAAKVTAKGSDVNGQYLEAMLTEFVMDEDSGRDHYYFAVGDLVELRDITGALKEDLGAITGFGTNFTSDPESATESGSRCRIYVSDASITSSIATGDHVTFVPWSGSNTARMSTYSAYASSAGALTGGASPKEYG
jgi:hypothetical protein